MDDRLDYRYFRLASESSSGVPAHLEHNLTDVEKVAKINLQLGNHWRWSSSEKILYFAQSTFNLTVIDIDDRRRFSLHQIPILKHLQIYAIYDWLAYNENKEGAPAQEQGGQIFQNEQKGLLYLFVTCLISFFSIYIL